MWVSDFREFRRETLNPLDQFRPKRSVRRFPISVYTGSVARVNARTRHRHVPG